MGKEILIGIAIFCLTLVNVASFKYLNGLGILIILVGSAIFAEKLLAVIAALP